MLTKESKATSRGGKIVGVGLALLLLAGMALGAWWLWGGNSGKPTAGPSERTSAQQPRMDTSSAARTTFTRPPDPLPIAELPGDPEEHPEVITLADMADKNYLDDKELAAYQKAGASDTKFHVQHLNSGATAPILLAAMDSGKKARTAVMQLRNIQLADGAGAAAKPPRNVYVTEHTDGKRAEIRAHYASGNVLVRIEVRSTDGLKAARKDFRKVLNAQLEQLPTEG